MYTCIRLSCCSLRLWRLGKSHCLRWERQHKHRRKFRRQHKSFPLPWILLRCRNGFILSQHSLLRSLRLPFHKCRWYLLHWAWNNQRLEFIRILSQQPDNIFGSVWNVELVIFLEGVGIYYNWCWSNCCRGISYG